MDYSTYVLVFFTILSTQCQVVAAATWYVGVSATLGFIVIVAIIYTVKFILDRGKKGQTQKVQPVERKVNTQGGYNPQPQVGHQPFQGQGPPPNQFQGPPPMPPGHMAPHPMHNDPAYPPSMPPGGGYGHNQPAANPFKTASYGH